MPDKLTITVPIEDLTPEDPLSLVVLTNEHLHFMRIKNYSEATINGRSFVLRRFIQWCYDRSITSVSEITREIFERYLFYLSIYRSERTGQTLGAVTRRGYLMCLCSFFNWLSKMTISSTIPQMQFNCRDQ